MKIKMPGKLLIKKECRLFIFGAGITGVAFQQQINEHADIICLGFLDNFVTVENTPFEVVRRIGIHKPTVLLGSEYDYVVIACRYELIPEICEELFMLGVPSSKILALEPYKPRNLTANLQSGWNQYYIDAEADAKIQLDKYIIPFIDKYVIPLKNVLDFPCGRGRISESLLKTRNSDISALTCCDSNAEAIQFCKERFSSDERIAFTTNKVDDLTAYPLKFHDNCFSFILSWDAMVHFHTNGWISILANSID